MLAALSKMYLKTARAWQLRLAFQEVYAQPSRGWAEAMMNKWLSWAMRSRIEPVKAVARTIRRHRDGILAWFDSRIANGLIRGHQLSCSGRQGQGARLPQQGDLESNDLPHRR